MSAVLVAHRSLVFAAALAGLLASCSGSPSSSDAATSSTAPEAATSSTAPGAATTAASATTIERVNSEDCPNRVTGSSSADFSGDGTYAVNLMGFDPATGEVSVDVVQWLSGQEADDAYADETGDSSGVPNDYWVANENPLVRTLPIASGATVWLVRLSEDASADVSTASLDEFPAYLDQVFEGTTWWATVVAGTVTELCEQYVP